MRETRWFAGNFEPTTADDPRINAGQVVDTETEEVLARASKVNGAWGVSFYGPLADLQHGSYATVADRGVVNLFKTIVGEGQS